MFQGKCSINKVGILKKKTFLGKVSGPFWTLTVSLFVFTSSQTRMLSPSGTRTPGSVWWQGPLQVWASPPVTPPAGPSGGSGAQVTGSSTQTHPSAWAWRSSPKPCPFLTAGCSANRKSGAAWKGLFTPCTRWACRSTTAKSVPSGTL